MNKTKQKVSNLIMFLILLFMSLRQLATFLEIPILTRTSISSDITMILLVASITVLFSIVLIYLPALCMVKLTVTLPKLDLSLPNLERVVPVYIRLVQQQNIFKLNCVIRC